MKKFMSSIFDKYKNEFQINKYANVNYMMVFNNEELERKFKERIYPFVTIEESAEECAFNFYALVDDSLHEHISQMTEQYEATDYVASYCTKESGTVRIKAFEMEDYTVVLSGNKNAIWILDKSKENVVYIGNRCYLDHFYREFFLMFEHILVKKCVERGAVLVHAAAVKKNNKVTIFVGNKRSGKTTTFFEMCKKGKYLPVSVDKVLLNLENNRINVYGVPTRLRVLAGTLNKYEELHSYIPEKYRNASDEELWKGASDSKVEMSLKEFENFIGSKFNRDGELGRVVFNHISNDTEKAKLLIGKTSENMAILKNNIFSPINPEEDWWSKIGIEKMDSLKTNRDNMVSIMDNVKFIDFETRKDFSLLFEEAEAELKNNLSI